MQEQVPAVQVGATLDDSPGSRKLVLPDTIQGTEAWHDSSRCAENQSTNT